MGDFHALPISQDLHGPPAALSGGSATAPGSSAEILFRTCMALRRRASALQISSSNSRRRLTSGSSTAGDETSQPA